MSLKRKFKDRDFDFIDSTGRNHELLQLWLKKDNDAIENTSDLLTDVFEAKDHNGKKIDFSKPQVDDALNVTHNDKQTYKTKIDLSILGDLLAKTGLGKLESSLSIEGIKEAKVSYDNTKTYLASWNEVTTFLHHADMKRYNPTFAKHLKRNNLILISGLATATDLKIELSFSKEIKAKLEAEMKKIGSADFSHSFDTDKSMTMTAKKNKAFPIAVKAHRILWKDGANEFNDIRLVSDNRNFF